MQQDKPLSELSTFGIGGPAKWFQKATTVAEMQALIKQEIPFIVIGKGSNTLFSDQGFNGLVIQNKIDFYEIPAPGIFHVGAGFSFSLLGVRTAQAGFTGLEFASGIPASVGGAIFMNAGANGSETERTLQSVDYIDEKGNFRVIEKRELHFGYRTSSFQKWKGVIVGGTFALAPSMIARQKQLEIIDYRKKTQPYSDKSAGCVFRNPECHFAGKLIEEAGLKGLQLGGAQVSEKHANFIINTGGATAQDVLRLVATVQERVYATHAIKLEHEIRVIPYTP